MRAPRDFDVAIRCDDLSVGRAGHGSALRAVDGVTLTLPRAGTLCVSGPTGSGKSSLAAVLAGSTDDSLSVVGGSATVCGVPLRRRGRSHRVLTYLTGFLPQGAGAALPARMTVSEVIGEPITIRERKVNARALAVRVASLLDEMHLPLGTAAKFPYELSAGMRQRVAIARSLVLDPQLLISDEPLANLDLEVRHLIYDAIVRRREEYQMATLIVSNDQYLARELRADMLRMRGGHVVAQGAWNDVLWTPDAHGDSSLPVS